jgi:hypothetical protein
MIILAILHATADLRTRKQGENGRFRGELLGRKCELRFSATRQTKTDWSGLSSNTDQIRFFKVIEIRFINVRASQMRTDSGLRPSQAIQPSSLK